MKTLIGDIVGSRFEFAPTNNYNFELPSEECSFTDDTICTVAVADALLKGRDYGESIHDWCRHYPHPMGGYGGRFAQWLRSDHPKPNNSFGNVIPFTIYKLLPLNYPYKYDYDYGILYPGTTV